MVRSRSKYRALGERAKGIVTEQALLGAVISLATLTNLNADEVYTAEGAADTSPTAEQLVLAEELLINGDTAYKEAKFREAASLYAQALGLGVSGEFRESVVTRFSQASVEQAKKQARLGDYAGARESVQEVLSASVDPKNKAALAMLEKLDDPIRYNPALTVEHSRDTENVRKWLYRAEGYYNLGQFDKALLAYEEVLQIDRFNMAARRGMERVTKQVTDYQESAYDQTRAQMLSKVDGAWEMNVLRESAFVNEAVLTNETRDRVQEVRGAKLRQIIVPVVDFQNVSIREAYDVIRDWSRQFDTQTIDDTKKGLNFVLNLGDADVAQSISSKSITLNVRNVPLDRVLDYVSQATGTQWMLGDHAVVVTPSGTADTAIFRRSFRVPPGFMQDATQKAAAQNDDPFADTPDTNSVLSARISAQEYLTQLGVSFPDGATANYIPGSNSLMVANTLSNMNLIEDLIRKFSRTESIQVVMTMTFMDVAMGDLEELGFDWLLGTLDSDDSAWSVGGGSTSSGRPYEGLGNAAGVFSPVTAGNRSGDYAFSRRGTDAGLIASSGFEDQLNSAPSPLVLTTEDVQVIMRGLAQKGSTETLNAPSVIARPGEKAVLYSGEEFIYPTEYEPAELPNSFTFDSNGFPVTPSHPTAFETRLTGLSMETEVAVSDDRNYVDVQMDVEQVAFEGFVNYGSPIQSTAQDPLTGFSADVTLNENAILMPVFRTIRPNTAVTVQDGANIVISALQQSDIEDFEDKVPVLGDIPLVGRFFQSSGTRKVDRALLIFVNVEIQDPTGKPWRDR
jgi:general secretion pathway protein D